MTLTQKPYDPPTEHALKTVYADESVIVCDKPSGLLSVPGRGPEKTFCASSIVADRFGSVLIVHRLDMDTSGLMVFARSAEAQRSLSGQFERRQIDKSYEALVEGALSEDAGTIDAAIAKYSLNRPLRHLDPDGREAITHWRAVDRTQDWTRVLLRPETGRSHQLRLHMKSLGHPILGDVFYGDETSHERLCLHAKSLTFSHPSSQERVSFETEVPF